MNQVFKIKINFMKLVAIIIYIFFFVLSSICIFYTSVFTHEIVDYTQTIFQIVDKPINGHLIVLTYYSVFLVISYFVILGQKKYDFFDNYPILDTGTFLLARLINFLSLIFILLALLGIFNV